MVHNFVEHLTPSTDYSTEYLVPLDEKNVGFVDVIVWSAGYAFLFDMKSESSDFSRDTQQLRRYAHSLRHTPSHSWRRIRAFLVYDAHMKDRVLEVRNVFGGVEIMLMEEGKEPVDLEGMSLNAIIRRVRGRFWRLRMICRILTSGAS